MLSRRPTWHTRAALLLMGLAFLSAPALGQPVFTGYNATHVLQHHTYAYDYYRIPTLVQAQNGTLLAFSEGRVNDVGDVGNIDLLVSRSYDGGLTWQSPEVLGDYGNDVWGNPTPVVDQLTGTIHLLSTIEENSRIMIQSSVDHGATWSTAIEITDTATPESFYRVGTGPVHGIQLERGANAGRLVVPMWVQPGSVESEFASYVLYSDDSGQNWQMGEGISTYANESTIVELTNGDIYFNTRNYDGSYHRAYATSSDGGETFGPRQIEWDLNEPRCQASVLRYSAIDQGDEQNRLLFANPDSPTTSRRKMTIKSSYDEGITWDEGKMIHRGGSAYSDMVKLPDGSIGLLYESGYNNPYHHITFARFTEEWLADPTIFQLNFNEQQSGTAPDGMTTFDHRGYDEHGAIRWGASFAPKGDGSDGNAVLVFDRGPDSVRMANEYTDQYMGFTNLDSFTFEVGLMTTAHDGLLDPLSGTLMAKGSDTTGGFRWFLQDGKNQFEYWDADGNSHLIMGTATVTDGQWHHLALVRNAEEGLFEFFVDYELDTWMWASTALVPGMGANDQALLIGCDVNSYNQFGDGQFVGEMDFIRVSEGALDTVDMADGAPEPILPATGDVNGDGLFDGDDVSAMFDLYGSGDLTWDLTGDFVIDFDDVVFLLDEYGHTVFGDLNIDGYVNGTDLSAVSGNFAGPGGYGEGDLNGDGFVNGVDLSNFSAVFPTGWGAAVPEPTSFLLLLAATGYCLKRRRR